jgi:hypothetical protein
VQPYLLKRVIDDHIVPGVSEGLMGLALLFLAAVVVGYLLQGGYVLAAGGRSEHRAPPLGDLSPPAAAPAELLDRQPAGRLHPRDQ